MGLVILAAGITMNIKTGLGVSTIISVPFAISSIWNVNFSLVTFATYALFVVIEMIIKGSDRTVIDWLQIPFSIVFSLLLNMFSKLLDFNFGHLWQNTLYLAAAIICTGSGMSMMIAMKFVPNPADGLAQAIGKAFGKNMGFGKNILDASCVAIACVIGLLFDKRIIGIGIGTVAAMLLVGRCVAVFDHFFKDRMKSAAGLAE
ncbi:MAG TPA: hypothetical protein DHU87_07670 [Ruminococcus sp.]|nr:hypothetical protein [Ruminococcus sp.]MBS6919140.1 hypothetical protein [Ruminococcus bicirculans (ex Wegman et al. 2014)]HBO20074.1 hypothetical protein [Ruminococcus sp.]HCY66432.1 hypothetical protein [Ruminococcus sp.]